MLLTTGYPFCVLALPPFIRAVDDIQGVRILRLHGPVGKEIGAEVEAWRTETEKNSDMFARPLLFDFKGTTGWDFSTVAYLVRAVRDRMATGARVGLINVPPELLAELDIAKIEDLFGVYTSEKDAIAGLAG